MCHKLEVLHGCFGAEGSEGGGGGGAGGSERPKEE